MKIVLGSMTFSDQVDQPGANDMVSAFTQAGYTELDTAYVYNKGETEQLLGRLNARNALIGTQLAGKANPAAEGGLSPNGVKHQLNTSLERLGMSCLDLFYLHSPDLSVAIRDTLGAVAQLHAEGKFKRFGLSNYAAWQVAEISEICRQEDWLLPSVYQGMYNALTRDVERELLPCLQHYGMAFYAYNPLAGGMLSGKHQTLDDMPEGGRFANFAGYQDRYWKPEYFEVVNRLSTQCRAQGIEPAVAALRWLAHHSGIANSTGGPAGDNAIIVGASSMKHFEQNIAACQGAALPQPLVDAFDSGWDSVRPACIKYFRP